MNRILTALLTVCALNASAFAADKYHVKDEGGFASTGRFIEFANRYGWQAYSLDYDFGIDYSARKLTEKSRLKVTITKRDGKKWRYTCKAKDQRQMWANINLLYGQGMSVLTECRVNPKKFAKAVGLEADLVGDPTLVFHVMVKDGQATAGIQKGFYFLEGGQIEASAMNQYASRQADPSNLGVLFASAMAPFANHPEFAREVRFLP